MKNARVGVFLREKIMEGDWIVNFEVSWVFGQLFSRIKRIYIGFEVIRVN